MRLLIVLRPCETEEGWGEIIARTVKKQQKPTVELLDSIDDALAKLTKVADKPEYDAIVFGSFDKQWEGLNAAATAAGITIRILLTGYPAGYFSEGKLASLGVHYIYKTTFELDGVGKLLQESENKPTSPERM